MTNLLHATGCSLRLFQLRHVDALSFADEQLSMRETVMARTNRASCLHRLGRLDELFVTRNEQFGCISMSL